jgi:quinol monooxygenase YgiN
MILITGKAKLLPEHREAIIAAANTMSAASLAETGCIDYRFWLSTEDPHSMLLLEQWEDQAALEAHFTAPHLAEFGAALGPAVDGGFEVTRFDIASSGPLF